MPAYEERRALAGYIPSDSAVPTAAVTPAAGVDSGPTPADPPAAGPIVKEKP